MSVSAKSANRVCIFGGLEGRFGKKSVCCKFIGTKLANLAFFLYLCRRIRQIVLTNATRLLTVRLNAAL